MKSWKTIQPTYSADWIECLNCGKRYLARRSRILPSMTLAELRKARTQDHVCRTDAQEEALAEYEDLELLCIQEDPEADHG